MTDFIQNIDWLILNGLQDVFKCGLLDFLMPKITFLGDGGAIWLICAAIMMFGKKYRKWAVILLLGLVTGLLIGNLCLKNLIVRSRPCWLEAVELLISNPTDYSFPSGHTLSSVIAATVLTTANKKFGYFAIPTAAIIAFSRLYLYVHFPSDVLASVILGLLIGFAWAFVCKKYFENFHIKNTAKR